MNGVATRRNAQDAWTVALRGENCRSDGEEPRSASAAVVSNIPGVQRNRQRAAGVQSAGDPLAGGGEKDEPTVTAPSAANLGLRGRVAYIDQRVDPATRTAKVRVEVPNRGSALRLGMFVTVTFQRAAGRRLTLVPRAVVQTIGDHVDASRSGASAVTYQQRPYDRSLRPHIGARSEREVNASAAATPI